MVAALIITTGVPVRADSLAANRQRLEGKIILLDPGHAVMNSAGQMINPGARARRGALERDIALSVAAKIVPLLESQGAKVFMTRTPTNPWRYNEHKSADNRARAILANIVRANAYVRIHCDWNRSKNFKGFTTYYYRWGSRDLAKAIRQSLAQALPTHRDNGIHRKSFVSGTAKMPAVLVELGVLSNKPESKDLANDAYQTMLAMAVTEGIVDYFKEK